MSKDKTYEQIRAYLYNTMPSEDRLAFEAELQRDEVLAKELKEQKMEHQIMEAVLEGDLRRDLRKWDRELDGGPPENPQPEKSFNRSYFIWIAASLILLALASVLLCPNEKDQISEGTIKKPSIKENQAGVLTVDSLETSTPTSTGKEDLIEDKVSTLHDGKKTSEVVKKENGLKEEKKKKELKTTTPIQTTPEKVIPQTQQPEGTDIKEDSIQSEADTRPPNYAEVHEYIHTFKTDEISRSATELTSITAADSTDLNARYALGLLYYQEGAFSSAVEYLEIFGKTQTDYLNEERAQLILGMAYIKNEELAKAKILLDKMTQNSDHQYYDYAVLLREGLADK